jgi:hypothetical protein
MFMQRNYLPDPGEILFCGKLRNGMAWRHELFANQL